MDLAKLNDVAIILQQTFADASVKFGLFDGYALAAMGAPIGVTCIRCVVGCNQLQLCDLLRPTRGFENVGSVRNDDICFLYRAHRVAVTFYPMSMRGLDITRVQIVGERMGPGSTHVLNLVSLLNAQFAMAMDRLHFADLHCIQWLVLQYFDHLAERRLLLSTIPVALTLARYPELEPLLMRMGFDMRALRAIADRYLMFYEWRDGTLGRILRHGL